jgi:AcrR family transcriptional regulator
MADAPPDGARPTMRARGRETRERLLAAGAEVFATRGLHAARVDDVVKGARTSHGTFYLYFANKEELFHALAREVAAELAGLAGRLPPLEPGPDGRRALEAWLGEFAALYERSGTVIRAWTEGEIVATDVGRLGTDVWSAFTRALADRIRATGADGIDPTIGAVAFVAMIERANYYLATGRATGRLDVGAGELAATLARIAQCAVFAPQSR